MSSSDVSPSYSIDAYKVVINNTHPSTTNVIHEVTEVINDTASSNGAQWYFRNDEGEWESIDGEANDIIEDGYQNYRDLLVEDFDQEADSVTYTVADNTYQTSFGTGRGDGEQTNTKTEVTRTLLRTAN